MSKDSKFHQNETFYFLISCHKIKINKLQSNSILVILYFFPKIILLFCSVESFFQIYLYFSWYLANYLILGKGNFDNLSGKKQN